MNKLKSVKKQMTFSKKTIEIAEDRAESLGLDFNKYVIYLITKDIDSPIQQLPVYYPSAKEIEEIKAALEDVKSGRLIGPFSTPQEIQDYADSL